MSPAQNSLYWREWSAVRAELADARPGWGSAQWDEFRHEIHRRALGRDMSHTDMRNADFDQVLAAFRSISQPDNMAPQLRAQDQPRRRLLFAIRRDYHEAYARSRARQKFGTDDIDHLTEAQLQVLRFDLANRANAQRKGHAELANQPF